MTLFRKNPNETAYTGGEKHWSDVIKNTASGNYLVWRQPEEDFNTNSTLIVMPGETAVFVKGGEIVETFENGTYKLSTKNYPFISRLVNAFTGGISTFNCVVYFVRKASSIELCWGTATPIQVRDNVFGIRTEARARGAYKAEVENPGMLIEKLIGCNVQCHNQNELDKYFAEEFQSIIKSTVSKFLNNLDRELIGIDEYLGELSNTIAPDINKAFAMYGLRCSKFSISGLDIDKAKYDELDKAQIKYAASVKKIDSDKYGLDALGDDWARVKGMEILSDMANNDSSLATAGAGIGMAMGTAEAFGAMSSRVFASTNAKSSEDPMETLSKLKKMLDADLIDKAEYDAKKAEILKRI